jgi:hypothetical protein
LERSRSFPSGLGTAIPHLAAKTAARGALGVPVATGPATTTALLVETAGVGVGDVGEGSASAADAAIKVAIT